MSRHRAVRTVMRGGSVAAQDVSTGVGQGAPIVHRRCGSCRRHGDAAPFALLAYRDVQRRGEMIPSVVEDRYAPPWHAVPAGPRFGDDWRLSEAEIAVIRDGGKGGMPPDDVRLEARVPDFPSGRALGEPDLEFAPPGVASRIAQVDPDLDDVSARARALAYGHDGNLPPCVDRRHQLIDACGAVVTPEVFVVTAAEGVVHRGRIDDSILKL